MQSGPYYIAEQVDINKQPEVQQLSCREISIGDLHANAQKFSYFLNRHNIIRQTPEQFDLNKDIYKMNLQEQPEFAMQVVPLYKQNIEGAQVGNRNTFVRLIGDELTDRGQNDLWILYLIKKLHQENIPFEILASNHAVEALRCYYENLKYDDNILSKNRFGLSSINLQWCIDQGIVTRGEIDAIIHDCYLPHLKIISYGLSEDESSITIYSHAAIDIQKIRDMARIFSLPFKDDTPKALAQTIESINAEFIASLERGGFSQLFPLNGIVNAFSGITDRCSPCVSAIWNRTEFLRREPRHKGYGVNYCHGHDSSDNTKGNNYNLDNLLGKTLGSNVGEYTVLATNEHRLDFQPALQENALLPMRVDTQNQVQAAPVEITALNNLAKTLSTWNFESFLAEFRYYLADQSHDACKEMSMTAQNYYDNFLDVGGTQRTIMIREILTKLYDKNYRELSTTLAHHLNRVLGESVALMETTVEQYWNEMHKGGSERCTIIKDFFEQQQQRQQAREQDLPPARRQSGYRR